MSPKTDYVDSLRSPMRRMNTLFGIRAIGAIGFDPDKGFFLNYMPVKIRKQGHENKGKQGQALILRPIRRKNHTS